MSNTSQAGKKFNQYHPKIRKAIEKEALKLLLATREQVEINPKTTFPIISDVEVHVKKHGLIVHPVVITNCTRINCACGQVIVDTSKVRAVLAAHQIVKTSTQEAYA